MVDAPRIGVLVADDGLTASVDVRAGDAAGATELARALREAGVVRGIDDAVFARVSEGLSDPRFICSEKRVAVGLAAVPGLGGHFEPAFHSGLQAGVLRDDGTMDFHDRGLLVPVGQGTVIGQIRPPTLGSAGFRVDGDELLPTAGRPLVMQFGPGAKVDEDGSVHATRAGVVLHKPGKFLDVVTQHVHTGNVDMKSGHLHMQGSVIVKGSVGHSFEVAATGDVEISGSVDDGSVHAGGHLRVRLGVRGGDEVTVTAAGDVSAHHAEAAAIHAGGTLKLDEAVHSQLKAQRIVVARRMRGGSAVAERSIVVGEVGMQHETQTVLSVGEPQDAPPLPAKRSLGPAVGARANGRPSALPSRMPADHAKAVKPASAGQPKEDLAQKLERIARREALLREAYIEVKETAYAGVIIKIGDDTLVLTKDERAVRFSYDVATRHIQVERA